MTDPAPEPTPRDRLRLGAWAVSGLAPLWLLPVASPSAALAAGATLVLEVWTATQVGLALGQVGLGLALLAVARAQGGQRRRRGLRLAAAALGLLLAAGLGEALLRVWPGGLPRGVLRHLQGGIPFRLSEPAYCVFDGPWAWRGQPGLNLPALPTEPELVREGRLRPHPLAEPSEQVALSYDAQGLRNPEPWGDVDVLAVGDSFTFGWNLPREAAWPAQLEARSGRPARSVAFNAWGPSQALAAFEAFGLPRQPQAVAWTCFAGNDLEEEAAWQAQAAAGQLPAPFQPRAARELPPPRGSRLWATLAWALEGLPPWLARRADSPREALTATVGGTEQALGFAAPTLRALGADPASWPQHPGFAGAVAALARGHTLSAAAGARFVCLLVPTKAELLYPLLPEPTRHEVLLRAFPQVAAEDDARRAQVLAALDQALRQRAPSQLDQLRDALAARGVPCLDLRPALRASYEAGRPPYFALDSHWNRTGHEVAAAEVARWLAEASARGE